MRTLDNITCWCWWTLLEVLITTCLVPTVNSGYSGRIYGSRVPVLFPSSHPICHQTDQILHPKGLKGQSATKGLIGQNGTKGKVPSATKARSRTWAERGGVALCESAWYRDLLQGVCQRGAGPLPLRPLSRLTGTAVETADGGLAAAVDNEWTKNFASPECGAKLGRLQQLLPVLWIQFIDWIWIQDLGPIWIRIQDYAINFERAN